MKRQAVMTRQEEIDYIKERIRVIRAEIASINAVLKQLAKPTQIQEPKVPYKEAA